VALKGSRELRARLRAIKTVFKPVGREWTEETMRLARSRVRVATGKTRASIRRKNASQTRAAVEASGGARFLEAGTVPHAIKVRKFEAMKFNAGGRTVFTKRVRHPGMRKQPFLRNSGHDALRKIDILRDLVDLWNKAS
jgi:hypothetical protein